MRCPQCGKESAGRYCPLCGHEIPAAPKQRLSRSHRSRVVLIVSVWLIAAAAATAWLAQTYGESYGWALNPQVTTGLGAPYTATLTTGHYTAGVDVPSGIYTVTAVEGQGSIAASAYSEWMGVSDEAPYQRVTENVRLNDGDELTVLGLTVTVYTAHAQSRIAPREPTDAEPVSLAGIAGAAYTAGTDFPAGDYLITAVAGKGSVSSDNVFSGGIHSDMSADVTDGALQEFRNVHLPEGTVLTLTGVDVRLTLLSNEAAS